MSGGIGSHECGLPGAFVPLAHRRIAADAPLFAQVSE